MNHLYIDFEAFSSQRMRGDKAVGTWRWAADKTTGLICMAYAFDDEEVDVWVPGQKFPDRIIEAAKDGCPIHGHNVQMERALWRFCLPRHANVPSDHDVNWRCTMAVAAYKSLPGGLDVLGKILDLPVKKQSGDTMKKWAKKARHIDDIPLDDLEDICDYCKDDVEVERHLHLRLGDLPSRELKIWQLDQRMNELGVYCDGHLAQVAMDRVADQQAIEAEPLSEITGGLIDKPTQNQRITKWIREDRGLDMPDLAADTVDEWLGKPDLDEDVRKVLQIRQRCAKSSTAKLRRLICNRMPNGRLCGNLRYHGALTGRWAGAGFQMHNMPRGLPVDMDRLADLFEDRDWDGVNDLCGNVFDASKTLIRGLLMAAPNKELAVSDFSAIEARVLAWLADEDWKISAFRDFDAGSGQDIYKLSYAMSFQTPVDQVDKHRRLIGKVQELALGYGGSVGAYATMARGYGIEIGDYFDQLIEQLPQFRDRAEWQWETFGHKSGHDYETYIAAILVVAAWRDANSNIASLWKELEQDAVEAVETGAAGRFTYESGELHMLLPSGRSLTFWDPKVVKSKFGKPTVKYRKPEKKQLMWEHGYGGKWSNYLTQGTARDVLAEAMLKFDRDAAPDESLILTIHDEIVAESKNGSLTLKRLESKMTEPIEWAPGLPIAAEGFTAVRYRKD